MIDLNEVTILLGRLTDGDRAVIDQLLPIVYDQLKKVAQGQLASERPDHTLNATALVHEAYMKMVDQKNVSWQNRAHFFALSAQAMRRILIDYARNRLADKRGGGMPLVTFSDELYAREAKAEELVALDDALNLLAKTDERQSKIVEYHFFGGLTHEEIAEVLAVSVSTIRRDWRFARAWLSQQLKEN